MRIAIDARMMRVGSMHGIARYVHHLLECFRDLGTKHQFYVLINDNSPLSCMTWPGHIKFVHCKSKWISFREQWELPLIIKKLRIDLLHAPSFVAPIYCPTTLLMTIHDLNHLVLPQFYTPLHSFYYQTFVKSCIERSRYILTVSNFSKNEIVRNLDIEPDKVFVTYNGVSESYNPVTSHEFQSYIRDLYELPQEFIFCLSNNKPHKNVLQLVRAYCYSNIQTPLVLACSFDANIVRLAEGYGKKHLIYFTKFIDEAHLPTVYSMTKLFVYPSTYEGFGLPPLEALSCGASVVVSRSASLPEVVGEHAIFMDPYNYQDIAKALTEGIDQTKENELALVQSKRIGYAKNFSWENMAVKTLDIYERCS